MGKQVLQVVGKVVKMEKQNFTVNHFILNIAVLLEGGHYVVF